MSDTEQTASGSTSLARRWVVRMVVIIGVLVAFGAWALFDATYAYPARGRKVAEQYKYEYLSQAAQAGSYALDNAGQVFDPKGDLEALRAKDILELSALDLAKRDWLDSLAVPGLGMLDPEHTRIENPAAELERLGNQLSQSKQYSDLNKYDILMQWLILAICWGIAAWMLVLFFSVSSRRFRWDAETRTLTLPGGRTIAPADLDPEDPADLTKWHKFIVVLRPRTGDPVRLDLFRYQPLEDWVRELVKAADPEFQFPDEIEDDEAEAPDTEATPEEPHAETPDEKQEDKPGG